MADIIATSVPGTIGIHLSATTTSVSEYRGLMLMTLAPFSCALTRLYMASVPEFILAGSQPQRIISFEFNMSSRECPTKGDPY